MITGDVDDGAVGFDYKWNMGWMNDFLGYMQCDPIYRTYHYGEMTFSMIYAYSERFILVLSHDEVVHGKGSMVGKMPGETFELKFANVRAAYGFMMFHPGRKLLFMGQEFGQMDEWNEKEGLQWYLYLKSPALWTLDDEPEGFEWIDCTNSKDNIVVFLRKSGKQEETLLVVCNFVPVAHEAYRVGVPYAGKYKEIFSSEEERFGGAGSKNTRAKTAKALEWDGREYSIDLNIPSMSVSIFSCTPLEEKKPSKKAAEKSSQGQTVKKSSAAAKTVKKGEKAKTAAKSEKKKPATAKKTAASKSSAEQK